MVKRTIEVTLRETMIKENYDQKRLAIATGLSERTISELINGKTKRYPKEALEKIAYVLKVTDMNDLITFTETDETEG